MMWLGLSVGFCLPIILFLLLMVLAQSTHEFDESSFFAIVPVFRFVGSFPLTPFRTFCPYDTLLPSSHLQTTATTDSSLFP